MDDNLKKFLPLAKTAKKVSLNKGFSWRSCFGSPDVGDVERMISIIFASRKKRSCFGSPDVGDVESQ